MYIYVGTVAWMKFENWLEFCKEIFGLKQGRREGVEPVIIAGARGSKVAQKSEIDLILGHILVFLGPKKCGISTNLGPCVEV
jgi:hypothetical protein